MTTAHPQEEAGGTTPQPKELEQLGGDGGAPKVDAEVLEEVYGRPQGGRQLGWSGPHPEDEESGVWRACETLYTEVKVSQTPTDHVVPLNIKLPLCDTVLPLHRAW